MPMKLFGVISEKGSKPTKNNGVTTPDGSINRFNLNLTRTVTTSEINDRWKVSNENASLQPLVSPALEEMPNWSILPSYQLYQSTFSKNIDPSVEDLISDPPTYEYAISPRSTPEESSTSEIDYFSRGLNNTLGDEPTVWENSILGNTHRLKSVSDFNKEISSSIDIRIILTDGPCQVGSAPSLINPQEFEFSQGDSIYGYFYVTNKSKKRVSFDMISVVFEGRISVMGDPSDTKKPIVFNKFLNMFDYYASWTPANWSNLESTIDPVDKSVILFPEGRYFEPGITYKKFFSFKIPFRLLDCACAADIPSHVELLPSFGLEKEQFINNLRRQREMSTQNATERNSQKQKLGESKIFRVKELSFPDTSISYSVTVRIVGKSSNYANVVTMFGPQKDEYVVLNYSSCYIRVIPRNLHMEEESFAKEKEAELFSKYYVKKIKEIVDVGNEYLLSTSAKDRLSSLENKLKAKQLYNNNQRNCDLKLRNRDIDEDLNVEIYYPFKKKILGSSKVAGSIGISTPKLEIRMKYIQPPNFKHFSTLSYTLKLPDSVQIPLKLMLHFGNTRNPTFKSTTLPSIKSVSARLVVVTFRSKKYPLPIEITNELLFKNIPGDDNIETHLVKPFKYYLSEISKIIEVVNPALLNVDRQLIMDIKSLASLSTKYNYLKFDKVNVRQKQMNSDWIQKSSVKSSEDIYEKNIDITLDLTSLLTREQYGQSEIPKDLITLVPEFQSCIMGRKYYAEITIKLNNNESYSTKVPLRIMA